MKAIEEITTYCPYCGEPICIEVDRTLSDDQDFIEDCPVCCRPIEIVASFDYDDNIIVTVKNEDEI